MVKLDPEDQRNLAAGHPGVVEAVPGYWGRKGSTFVAYESADETLASTLLEMAWTNVAPARLKAARPRSSSPQASMAPAAARSARLWTIEARA